MIGENIYFLNGPQPVSIIYKDRYISSCKTSCTIQFKESLTPVITEINRTLEFPDKEITLTGFNFTSPTTFAEIRFEDNPVLSATVVSDKKITFMFKGLIQNEEFLELWVPGKGNARIRYYFRIFYNIYQYKNSILHRLSAVPDFSNLGLINKNSFN